MDLILAVALQGAKGHYEREICDDRKPMDITLVPMRTATISPCLVPHLPKRCWKKTLSQTCHKSLGRCLRI